jgi:hypothetical protein
MKIINFRKYQTIIKVIWSNFIRGIAGTCFEKSDPEGYVEQLLIALTISQYVANKYAPTGLRLL